jgi:Kef-type K+ transport system membrane component KefB
MANVLVNAPLWTLEGLRAADPVLVLALLLLVAVLVAELLHRAGGLPRACGHMLTGALAGPLLLRVVEPAELDPWKPLIDLAIGALLFELGTRIRPRWLLDNRGLAASAVLQALLTGLLVAAAAMALGVPATSAAVAGSVAAASSPVIVLTVAHELGSRGQVTERMLMMAAINSVLAVLALKVMQVVLAAGGGTGDPVVALAAALRVVSGSFLLGVVAGWGLSRIAPMVRGTPSMPVVLITIVILATMVAAHWTLSPLLALLVAGMVARARMRHGLTVEPHLGSAGAALNVMLFVSLGLLLSIEGIGTAWPWALLIIAVRLAATAIAVSVLAPASGLGWRQAGALVVALQPMSGLAMLLAADTFGWPSQLPGVHEHLLQSLLLAVAIMQFTGPVWTRVALGRIAREGPTE